MGMISVNSLVALGLNSLEAEKLLEAIDHCFKQHDTNEKRWQIISKKILTPQHAFSIHLLIFTALFPMWRENPETAPAWIPDQSVISSTHIFKCMTAFNLETVHALHHFSITHYLIFWEYMIRELNIIFHKPPQKISDTTQGIEAITWLPGAAFNIVDSCLSAPPHATAMIYQETDQTIHHVSFGELTQLVNQVANSLVDYGVVAGDTIGMIMPMTPLAVAIYLGIIKMGGVVVSIADSFSSEEIAIRLQLTKTKAVFTQDFVVWNGKKMPLYEKIKQALPNKIIVIPNEKILSIALRDEDHEWKSFLSQKIDFTAFSCQAMTPCHILFSSGTTAEPKAIIWNHSTPIKVASDAYFHQNIQANDVLAWPTNLGWMMGPWLIYAAFIHHATIALYPDAPKDQHFGRFIQNAKVTMLGVVPTLVAHWRKTQCMEGLDWHRIKMFSSTGECSNPEDMLYLMSLAGYQPVIEYCGGTEIGGAYMTSTVIENNYPSLFSTPAMGLNVTIINEEGQPASVGEVAIIPPSIGLSTQLLNANHHDIYYANMPLSIDGEILRRHGDQIKRLANGYYMILGRTDDTMNLGGIKISAAEIERALAGIPEITEIAAIGVPSQGNGPEQLVIYASTQSNLNKNDIMKIMQKKINDRLNPLFKIHDLVFVDEITKTASNKMMRRVLRKTYLSLTTRKHQ